MVLWGGAKTITNIKFNTVGETSKKTNDQSFIGVAGIYTFNNQIQRFSEKINYNYTNKKYDFINLTLGKGSITQIFSLNLAVNTKLNIMMKKAMADKGHELMQEQLVQTGIFTFNKNDYNSNLVSATFVGKCRKNAKDDWPVMFKMTVNYDFKTQQYSLVKLDITKIEFVRIRWAARSSMNKLPNYNSKFKYSEQVIESTIIISKVNIDPATPNKITIDINGRFLETPPKQEFQRVIKRFSETITFDSNGAKEHKFSSSQPVTDNVVLYDVFSKAHMLAGMKNILENYPKYKGQSITDIKPTIELWLTLPLKSGDKLYGTQTQSPFSFKHNGKDDTVYGDISYNFKTKMYSYDLV